MSEDNEIPMMQWVYDAYQKNMQSIFDEALEDSSIKATVENPERNYHFSIAKVIFRWNAVDNDGLADLSTVRYVKAYEANEFTIEQIAESLANEVSILFNGVMEDMRK